MLVPWQIKVAGFKLLSLLPAGESLYRAMQQHLTRSIVPTPPTVQQKLEVGRAYLNLLQKFHRQELLAHATHIDIGCGWMPTIPLLFYALGCERQLLCDVRRHLSPVTVPGTVEIVRRLLGGSPPYTDLPLRRLPPPFPPDGKAEEYLAGLGMSYVAPYCLRDLVRPSPLLVTCTQVLMYLSPSAVRELLLALAGTLTPGDLFIVGVKCYDLYSDCDPGLSPYNKWTYSPLVWESFINSRLMSFNRMTAADYRRLLLECGFKLIFFEETRPAPAELEALRSLRIHASFQHVPREELAAKEFLAVAATGSPASGLAKH
ncbi:MAG TPA: hypothetical protein VJQ50_00495 [Terriglobales bacterium]|jgi:hypothetical protein|nr:hypothetical protein [Terriglobales bacterium]